jgi:hypothetical protein
MTEDRPEPDVLAGRTLIQVCIGEHQVIMHFDREFSVSVETKLLAPPADGARADWLGPPMAGSALLAFLGQSVEDARIDENGDLVLSFESGPLYVRRIPSGGESFQISGPGVDLIY